MTQQQNSTAFRTTRILSGACGSLLAITLLALPAGLGHSAEGIHAFPGRAAGHSTAVLAQGATPADTNWNSTGS